MALSHWQMSYKLPVNPDKASGGLVMPHKGKLKSKETDSPIVQTEIDQREGNRGREVRH